MVSFLDPKMNKPPPGMEPSPNQGKVKKRSMMRLRSLFHSKKLTNRSGKGNLKRKGSRINMLEGASHDSEEKKLPKPIPPVD